MQVHQVMTKNAEYVLGETSLDEAARKMRDLNTGFLPIADKAEDKLQGIITDRDITVRAVAEGKDPGTTKAMDIKTDEVMYCYQQDSVEDAAKSMQQKQMYRLIVLNNPEEKRLSGVVSLGDIVRQNKLELSGETAKVITS
jgi:CBS domain-containing protein